MSLHSSTRYLSTPPPLTHTPTTEGAAAPTTEGAGASGITSKATPCSVLVRGGEGMEGETKLHAVVEWVGNVTSAARAGLQVIAIGVRRL